MQVSAAAYVRMSTDQQDLSIGIQLDAIEAYAEANGLQVARVYRDAGRSGLEISKRDGMKQMLRDVMDVPRPFDVILVYDVSRWGRFQDVDAAAYYEYTCKLHGVQVVYIQEKFGADDDPMTALMKAMQRTMAAKYSRDLGIKTRAGQDRAVKLGYQMGPLPSLGLTRIAIDRDGNRRPLARGQYKGIQSEHIVWVPGPKDEVDLVNRIFRLYAEESATIASVVRRLAEEKASSSRGRSFTHFMVDRLLRTEALVGNFVWGRARPTKRAQRKKSPASRAENVIEPIVPARLWAKVQKKLLQRSRVTWEKEQLLKILRSALAAKPGLCPLDLEAMGYPKFSFAKAFGSLARAMEFAGRDLDLVRAQHKAHRLGAMQLGKRLTGDICALLEHDGIVCSVYPKSRFLMLEDGLIIRVQLVWPRVNRGVIKWNVQKTRRGPADLVLLAQMDQEGRAIRFVMLDRNAYRNLGAWLGVDAPRKLEPLLTPEALLESVRAHLTRHVANKALRQA